MPKPRVRVDCMDAGVRATPGAVAEGVKFQKTAETSPPVAVKLY